MTWDKSARSPLANAPLTDPRQRVRSPNGDRVLWTVTRLVVAVLLVTSVSSTLDAAAANIRRWREKSEVFVFEQFGATPDPWQRDALAAWDDPAQRRISLQACVGPGKTTVLAWCAWHFLSCYGDKGEHPKAVAFSITGDNLDDYFWPELAKWQQRSEYLRAAFTLTAENVFANHHPDTWFLSARSWPKTASAEEMGKTVSGLHSKYVAIFADESGAIPVAMLRAADQALSTGPIFGKILQAGNPISLDGMLYAAASFLRHQWTVIRITGDPDDPNAWVYSPRVMADAAKNGGQSPLDYAREQIATYGRDNPWVMSQILGHFPPSSLNALLGVEDVEAAMARTLRSDRYDWAQKRLGIDVARFGDDRTVIFPRQGLVAFRPDVMRHKRDSAVSTDIATKVMAGKAAWGSELEIFDATGGWAAGAVDVLRANGYSPVNVQFAAPAIDPRYRNRRAEIHFHLAEWVKGGGALPPVPELVAELTTPTYTFSGGKLLIEEKDQVKKRLGRSPDLADALALTFGVVDMPAAFRQTVQAQADPSEHEVGDPWRFLK